MEIETLHLTHLQNDEHYNFMLETAQLIDDATPKALKIENEYALLQPLLADEKTALHPIQASAFTVEVTKADEARDTPTLGIFKVTDGLLHHFDPEVAQAAYRIKVALDSFRGITRLPYAKQTAETIKLIENLNGPLAADVAKAGLTPWVAEIEAKNSDFIAVVGDRYNELDSRTDLRMKDVRVKIDAAYRDIVKRINALMVVEGEVAYAPFVSKLNLRIDSYNASIAKRAALNAKKAEKEKKAI
jgi:hypothetical protein